uniref:Uncharacterized protein n=1 Tax=Anguilla anguilla TaxID=7936 RepID=A0A0E9XZM7_ANGAN
MCWKAWFTSSSVMSVLLKPRPSKSCWCVFPLAPKDRAARATDTLSGEKKTFLD